MNMQQCRLKQWVQPAAILLMLTLVVPSSWACTALIGVYEQAEVQYRVKRQKNKFVLLQRAAKSDRWMVIETSSKGLTPNEIARRFGIDTDSKSCAIEYQSGVLVKTFIGARYVRQADQSHSPVLTPSRTGVLLFPAGGPSEGWGKDFYPLAE